MDIKRMLAGVATAVVTGSALAAGIIGSAPNRVYHDLIEKPVGADVVVDSAIASQGSGVYHDL